MVLLSFDVPPSEPPALAVLLAYPRAWGDCPDATIEAELDGVPLDPAPNATVRGDAICQIGFMPAAPPSPVDTSTIQLTRDTQTASVSIQGLLPTRTLATTVPDGATVAAGQTIDFVWSSASDAIASADAAFVSGNVMQHAQTEVVGSLVHVVVPPLAKGAWLVRVGVVAEAPILTCEGLVSCETRIVRGSSLSVNVGS